MSSVESLEGRRLLSAAIDPIFADPTIERVAWKGGQINAVAGEMVVMTKAKLGALTDLIEGPGPVASTNMELKAVDPRFEVKEFLGASNMFIVKMPAGLSFDDAASKLSKLPGVVSATPNQVGTFDATTPNDTHYSKQWGLNNTGQAYIAGVSGTVDADVDAPEAWDYTTGSSSVVVAVLDSGVNYTHSDLNGNMWVNPGEIVGDGSDNDGNGSIDDVYGYDFANNDGDPSDSFGHGTWVSGVIAAEGGSGAGVAGVSWRSKIMALRIGNSAPITSKCISALNYITSMRNNKGINIRVANMSVSVGNDPALKTAIDNAGSSGIIVVASAGNNGVNIESFPEYPASYTSSNLITVAATDDDDALAAFTGGAGSNYGSVSVDLGAPGKDIYTTNNAGSYEFVSGTSFSAPMVAGVAALAFSMKPDLTVDQVKSAIVSQGNAKSSLSGKTYSGKRLNAYNTLNYIQSTYSGYSKTYIGDVGGAPLGDDIRLDVSGSNTLIKRYQSGSYQTIATVANSASKAIGIFTLAGDDAVTIGTGVLNTLYINSGSDDDVVQGGGAGGETIKGDAGADAIFGNGGNDSIEGGDGNDSINGGDGNDTIKGQGGSDSLRGGNNDDLFDAVDNIADQVLNGDAGTDSAYYDNPEDNSILASIEDPHPV